MEPIGKDKPGVSTVADVERGDEFRKSSPVPRKSNEDEEKDDGYEDDTCCHRATFCNPVIREIIVTEPISTCLGQKLTWANLFWMANTAGIILMVYAILYFLLGDTMLLDGRGFRLFVLIISSYLLGWTIAYIPHLNLPPVFGMLLAGIIIRNTDFYNIREELGTETSSKIRIFCLTFITIRAGLQLTTTALRKHPLFVLILAIVPCTVEMLALSTCCRYILQYPWDWAFMTGTIIACMSPVVTVNCILALAERGYGEDKGIATLLCTATSIDAVHIVALFAICFSFVFSNDEHRTEWWSYIPGGLRDLLLGLVVGIILGFCLVFFPHRNHRYAMWYRISSLIFGALMCTTAASKLAISGGGYLASVTMSFIAITGWRILTESYDTAPLRRAAYFLWHFMQPALVGVIGADIDFKDWSIYRFGLYVTTIFVGLTARSIAAFLTTLWTPFTWKERLFVVISWLPKGTLQAALAPMAYEHARMEEDAEKIELALDVVRISVIAIVFLAPLGAIVMMATGPFLLNKISLEEHRRERELSYLRIVSLQPVRTRTKRRTPSMNRATSTTEEASL
ncbi:hypothetical protein KM043_012951 [Ampulex compressa]|nr:hypothetical protein KM043_012951 [Ampulex compressa]